MAVLCVAEVTTGGAPQQAWWGVAVETRTWCTAGGMEAGVAAVERVWRVLKKLKELLQDPATSGYRPIRTKRDENSCLQTHVHLVDYYSAHGGASDTCSGGAGPGGQDAEGKKPVRQGKTLRFHSCAVPGGTIPQTPRRWCQGLGAGGSCSVGTELEFCQSSGDRLGAGGNACTALSVS